MNFKSTIYRVMFIKQLFFSQLGKTVNFRAENIKRLNTMLHIQQNYKGI